MPTFPVIEQGMERIVEVLLKERGEYITEMPSNERRT